MKYKYTRNDLDLISWERIDKYLEQIYKEVLIYITKNNLKIKYIIPILRGGGIPAIKLSHMFNVIDMFPVQLKTNEKGDNRDILLNLDYVNNKALEENECILLVEGNHVTGTTANKVVNLIEQKFGENSKIIYISISRDYFYKDSVKNIIFTTWAMDTNETKKLSQEECEKLNINYGLVSVYPWENIEEELYELNKD